MREDPPPLLSLVRPHWTAGPGDRWHEVASVPEARPGLLAALGRRVFVTTGRQGLTAFADVDGVWFLIRCVDPPRRAAAGAPAPGGARPAARTTPRPSTR